MFLFFIPFSERSALAYTESSEEAKGVEVGGVCSTKVVGAHVSLDPVRPRSGNCDVHTLQLDISGGDSHSYGNTLCILFLLIYPCISSRDVDLAAGISDCSSELFRANCQTLLLS